MSVCVCYYIYHICHEKVHARAVCVCLCVGWNKKKNCKTHVREFMGAASRGASS